jgi:hypothetical protein
MTKKLLSVRFLSSTVYLFFFGASATQHPDTLQLVADLPPTLPNSDGVIP